MCRTVNGPDINFEETFKKDVLAMIDGTYNNQAYQFSANQKDGRGNLAPVTIILPTLAMEAKGDVEKFISLLDKKLFEARDMLLERYELMKKQSPASARFMYENGTMLGYKPEEGIESALKHGTLVIGKLGMAEALQILIGCDHTTEIGMALAKRIEQLYKDRTTQFKQEYNIFCSQDDLINKMIEIKTKKDKKSPTRAEIEEITKFVESRQ